MKNIYIGFCGYRIKLIIKNHIKSLDLINSITLNYLDAMIKPSKINDLIIVVEDLKGPEVFIKNNLFFTKTFNNKGKKIFADYTLGIYGLEYILFYFLEKKTLYENCIILHASSIIDKDKKCHIFLGRQGIGKSTIIVKLTNKGFMPLTDDNVFVRNIGKKFICYQMPFINAEKNTVKNYSGYQLESVNFLRKSSLMFKVLNISKSDLIRMLKNSKKKYFFNLIENDKNIYNFIFRFKNFIKLYSDLNSEIKL